MLTISCAACNDDPDAKYVWGCESTTQAAVWSMDGEEFFNCPIKFIPENVWSWYQQYTYAEQFNKIREYWEMPARWIEAYHYFRGQSNHFVEVVAESRKKRQDRTGDGLAMLTQTKKRLTNGRDD